jgi:hypothetical protein
MSNTNHFSGSFVYSMNLNDTWKYNIQNASQLDPTQEYQLHATGYADLSGRKYVALPANTQITEQVKQKYNLL